MKKQLTLDTLAMATFAESLTMVCYIIQIAEANTPVLLIKND